MIFVQGWILIDEADLETVIPSAQKMAEQTVQEQGCHHYCFARDVSNPQKVHIMERWIDEESLSGHFQTDHMAEFNATLSNVKIEAMDVRMYAGEEVKVMMQS